MTTTRTITGITWHVAVQDMRNERKPPIPRERKPVDPERARALLAAARVRAV